MEGTEALREEIKNLARQSDLEEVKQDTKLESATQT